MKNTLDNINLKELAQYKNELSTLTGNVLMSLSFTPNKQRPEQVNKEEILISFKSLVLQSWSKGWPAQYSEYDFLNFFLNYVEIQFSRNKCNQQRFVFGFLECTPRKGQIVLNNLYNFKNLRENDIHDTSDVDEIILVVAFEGMLFCYIYWISRHMCYVLDVQHNARSRFGDHRQILTEILKKQYNISRTQECNIIQLAEVSYNKIQNQLIRASLILDLINKYIKNVQEVYKVERIQINQEDSATLIDQIVWFVYKTYKEHPNKIKQAQYDNDNPKNNVTFNSWAKDLDYHHENKNYQNRMAQSELVRSQLKDDQQPTQNQKLGKFLGERQANHQSYLSKIANSQIVPSQSYTIDASHSINPPEIIKSVKLNHMQHSQNKSHQDIRQNIYKNDVSTIRADQFIQEAAYREAPKQQQTRNVYYTDHSQMQNKQPTSQESNAMNKSQMMDILDSFKKDIRKDLEEEFQKKLDQKELNKPNEKDMLQQAIVEEYMNQIKFQKYQDYMQYLLSYYQNYDPQKYKQLLEEYHNRLQSHAINGFSELQKKEMIKLVSMTKEKVLQQNQQIDLALFNQKNVLDTLYKQKREHKKQINLQEVKSRPVRVVYEFSKPQEVNPYQFKDESHPKTEIKHYDEYKLVYPYAEEEGIEQAYNQWDFMFLEQKQRKQNLIQQNNGELQQRESFDSYNLQMEDDMLLNIQDISKNKVIPENKDTSQDKISQIKDISANKTIISGFKKSQAGTIRQSPNQSNSDDDFFDNDSLSPSRQLLNNQRVSPAPNIFAQNPKQNELSKKQTNKILIDQQNLNDSNQLTIQNTSIKIMQKQNNVSGQQDSQKSESWRTILQPSVKKGKPLMQNNCLYKRPIQTQKMENSKP